MADKVIVESVGIELETEDISRNSYPGISTSESMFQATHDASIESDLLSYNGIPVTTNLEVNLGLRNAVFGAEYVSGIIYTGSPYLGCLKQLTNYLISAGENNKSYRAGFHVHVNCPYNLIILKSIIRLARHLEQVFFLLGGMGYDYRGKKNDSIYCRPITGKGPVCVNIYPRSFGQVFTTKDLLESKTIDQFKERYGDYTNLNPHVGRYMPVRYHWINLKPMFEQGSLEFRVFNKSLNPHYLWAIIELCKSFVYYVIQSSFQSLKENGLTEENSVFDVEGTEVDKKRIIKTFEKFAEISGLVEKTQVMDVLYDILNLSDVSAINLPDEYVFTHLLNYNGEDRCPRHWNSSDYTPNKIVRSQIKTPDYIDLYRQRSQNRTNRETRESSIYSPSFTRISTNPPIDFSEMRDYGSRPQLNAREVLNEIREIRNLPVSEEEEIESPESYDEEDFYLFEDE